MLVCFVALSIHDFRYCDAFAELSRQSSGGITEEAFLER